YGLGIRQPCGYQPTYRITGFIRSDWTGVNGGRIAGRYLGVADGYGVFVRPSFLQFCANRWF
ncbi:MAG: hypothetical protein MK322_14720, partial [Pseudomonadales bacterium]|nr:hypothetical protein [Pseudomonadales bacterium]